MPTRRSFSSRAISSARSRWIWSATRKPRLGVEDFLTAIQCSKRARSEGTRHFLDLKELELIALFDVVVILELDTALEAFLDFAHIVFQALQGFDLSGVDHHVFAQQTEVCVAGDLARSNHTTRHGTDLGRHKHGADLGRTDD